MPAGYRLFYVSTWRLRAGKGADARAWYDQAKDLWSRLPGVLSITSYVQQFSLGPDTFQLEVWAEIDDYQVLDKWDEAVGAMADEFIAVNSIGASCVRQGPSRLVGDYVGSGVEDLRSTFSGETP